MMRLKRTEIVFFRRTTEYTPIDLKINEGILELRAVLAEKIRNINIIGLIIYQELNTSELKNVL